MSDSFDPYHKWLGIPPVEQPPNHYRLLGIATLEGDADVIDAAANQRMAYLQDMAVGQHVEHSQRLLNEISAARRCLLNPQSKAAYDAQLQQPAGQLVSEAPFVPIITTDAPVAAAAPARTAARKSPNAADPETAEKSTPVKLSPAWIAAFSSIGVLSLIIALFLIFGGKGTDRTQADSGTLKVKWKLDERESALMMIDGEEVFDSQSKHPDKAETLAISVSPGKHDFYFERDGYRAIRTSFKFLPGESHAIELKWRRR
jgi:hypothetical protein